ncbi:MAG: hypothetical protein GX308_01015 [Epulopiscium sp.]|nr:hypothetical protein [Candidatus Epulonipiscium sp.]
MNHLNQNSYGLQDIPEPFRGQRKDFSNINVINTTEPQTSTTVSSARSSFAIEDLFLILLLFILLSDYKW